MSSVNTKEIHNISSVNTKEIHSMSSGYTEMILNKTNNTILKLFTNRNLWKAKILYPSEAHGRLLKTKMV